MASPIQFDLSQVNKNLAEFSKRLDKIEAQMKEVGTEAGKTGQKITNGFTTAAKSQDQLQKEIKQTEAQLKKLQQQSSKSNATLGEISAATAKIKRLKFELNSLNKAQTGTAVTANTASKGITKMGASASLTTRLVTSLRTTMITTFGVFGAIRFVSSSIKTIANFEKAMANVKAITGAAGEDFERLAKLATDVSNSGIFSAVEVANLEVKLAKLGFTISEIANMTEGIVALATATGEDLGTAAELTASTIRGLGLDASETTKVVDQLGKAFVTSGLDINKYRESIKFIAPIAKDMGIELDAIVAILGQLADRQIFGSLAGTAFRRVLIRLGDSSSELSKKIGFTVKSSDDLIKAFTTLKEQGTTFEELLQLIDVRSLTAVSALIDISDTTKAYREEIKEANGEIDKMANIQLETLSAKVDNLQRKWENLLITMSGADFEESAFIKTIGALVDTGASIVDSFTFMISLGKRNKDNIEEQNRLQEEKLRLIEKQREITKLDSDELDARIEFYRWEIDRLEEINRVKTTATEESLKELEVTKELLATALKARSKFSDVDFESLETLRADLQELIQEQAKVNIVTDKGMTIFKLYGIEIEKVKNRINTLTGKLGTNKKEVNKSTTGYNLITGALKDLNTQLKEAIILGDSDKIFDIATQANDVNDLKKQVDDFTNALINNEEQFAEIIDGIRNEQIKKRDTETKLNKERLKQQKKDADEEKKILEERKRAFTQFANEAAKTAQIIADAIVEAADRRVDAINNAITEAQNALQIELQLNEQGFASNVSTKRKELEELEALRAKALEDQKKALAIQRTIENATQAINLATAISNVIKSLTGSLGFFGILASVGAGAALFSVFESLTKQATETANKFEKGGWRELGGKRHSQGGVNLGEIGEGEKGEVVSIFNRSAVKKHKGLITNFTDMVNNGRIDFDLNHDVIGKIGQEAVVVNSTVSLDESAEIREMNSLMKKSLKKHNQYSVGKDKYIIRGNKTTIIRG